MRMENTVCVFTLQCFGLLRQTACQLKSADSKWKKQGVRQLEPCKRFPPLRSNGAVSAPPWEYILYVAERGRAGE